MSVHHRIFLGFLHQSSTLAIVALNSGRAVPHRYPVVPGKDYSVISAICLLGIASFDFVALKVVI